MSSIDFTHHEYRPLHGALPPDPRRIFQRLSAQTRQFLSSVEISDSTGGILSSVPWTEDTLHRYNALDWPSREALIRYKAFLIHEVVHQIDYQFSPFGASYVGRSCLETLDFIKYGAALFNELQIAESHAPLRDVLRTAQNWIVTSGLEVMSARVRWHDAFRGAAASAVLPLPGPGSVRLGGMELERVVVHEVLATARIPGAKSGYLRPATILETRAVAIAGLNVLNTLGRDLPAAADVARLLDNTYAPRAEFPDYVFLSDLYVGLFGYSDFEEGVQREGVEWLEWVLQIMASTGWLALHSVPGAHPANVGTSSPVVRLVTALQLIDQHLAGQEGPIDLASITERLDATDMGGYGETVDADRAVDESISFLEHVRAQNHFENSSPILRRHFDRLLELQLRALTARRGKGYGVRLGLLLDGDIEAGMREFPPEVQSLFSSDYLPPTEVKRYLALRETIVFRHARPQGIWDEWMSLLYPADAALGSDGTERLLTRTKMRLDFIDNGVWPKAPLILSVSGSNDTPVDVYFLVVPEAWFAHALELAKNDVALDVSSQWSALVVSGDVLIRLTISWGDTPDRVRGLFSLRDAPDLIRFVAENRMLAVLTEEAYDDFLLGGNPSDCLIVTVDADPQIVLQCLSARETWLRTWNEVS